MDDTPVNILSLCSGIAGLDLGVSLAVPGSRGVGYVEREAYAAACILARMEYAALEPAPFWCGDLADFDGRPWCGAVDILTAGYPCQPFSVAGKRRGADDPRHLWPHVRRILSECGAPVAFLENEPGHLRLGAREVIRDLHGLGYQVAAGLFTAAEVGASHRRERLFILGLADGGRERLEGDIAGGAALGAVGRGGGAVVADAAPLAPPGPADTDRWRDILVADPSLEPALCRVANGLSPELELAQRYRVDRLRALGNAVVPLEAAYAFCALWTALQGDDR